MDQKPYINTGNLSEDEVAAWLSRLAKGRGHIDFLWGYKLEEKVLSAINNAQEALAIIETKLSALQSDEFHQSETLTNDIQVDIDALKPLAAMLNGFVSAIPEYLHQVRRLSQQRRQKMHTDESGHERE
ncbi:hypothetical protein [Photorhabdus luminescens]|uniref:Uncharacterized protein n=1 Tax=Photorhabdus luminescens subsp. mexicana TaxID=2100167 RepID=A0A4R4J5U2_PHOLU|nr:hypothetical protein [Photorhabdus luminescens]TDB48069.1 hypothetical protein C5468_16835 [Photorhabdus luminescens subsp. mexicana]